ncbi:unnamed protein product [Closterium sp. NIES-65]|nr:unnamed protein product [Closterium sp. NIES-65]
MEDIWKEAFPVGTEWDQYDKVYEIEWDFSNLDEAFDEGGPLHDKRVYLFGCTEPQLVHWKGKDKVVHVPAVVAMHWKGKDRVVHVPAVVAVRASSRGGTCQQSWRYVLP